jgi:hypothetical protein
VGIRAKGAAENVEKFEFVGLKAVLTLLRKLILSVDSKA